MPVLLVSSIIVLFIAGRFAGAVFGPVNLWNTPYAPPSPQQMIGTYTLTAQSAELIHQTSSVQVKPSAMMLLRDGTADFQNVYEYVEPFEANSKSPLCRIDGHATWKPTQFGEVILQVHVDADAVISGPAKCSEVHWLSYAILGRKQPKNLWSYIGDPDDEGLDYRKSKLRKYLQLIFRSIEF